MSTVIVLTSVIGLPILSVLIPIFLYRSGDHKSAWICADLSIFLCVIYTLFVGAFFVFTSAQKPIIYLYPEQEQQVSVKLVNDSILTTSYPKYDKEWNVLAKTNGDLVDLKTGRNLYALYWEGNTRINANLKEGFVVKGEDSAQFLEEKLAILGLNEREAEEFIVYWLPQLESNKYNFIRFATQDEINKIMPLEVNPKPDTMIRVYMEFKSVNKNYKCEEQILDKQERKGFTLVEWGGIKIR